MTERITTRVTNMEWEAAGVREGELLWTPSAAQIEDANLTRFAKWLARERGLQFESYNALWQWPVTELEEFSQALWDYFGIQSSAPHTPVLGKRTMPGAEWFSGAQLNYAQHVLRNERAGIDAPLFMSETTPLTSVPWEAFAGQVRVIAMRLRRRLWRTGKGFGFLRCSHPLSRQSHRWFSRCHRAKRSVSPRAREDEDRSRQKMRRRAIRTF